MKKFLEQSSLFKLRPKPHRGLSRVEAAPRQFRVGRGAEQ
jgi:hypothetical protein